MTSTKYPWSLHDGDKITELVEHRQGAYPHPDRFPAPTGKEHTHGPFITVRDARQGDIRLECVWQPVWDTQVLGAADVQFFQNPAGRSEANTNLWSAGCFSWPRRYYVWEIVFQFGPSGVARFVPDYMRTPERVIGPLADKIVVNFQIGEKRYYQTPLSVMFRQYPLTYRAALCSALYIPPVQNFRAWLSFGKEQHFPSPQMARCILNGYLLRELQ